MTSDIVEIGRISETLIRIAGRDGVFTDNIIYAHNSAGRGGTVIWHNTVIFSNGVALCHSESVLAEALAHLQRLVVLEELASLG